MNDCIPYINDLKIEIDILNDIKNDCNCDVDKIDELINNKQLLMSKCKENLSKLSINNIEYRLYLKILNGSNASNAVKEVAEENYLNDIKPNSVSWIWKYYKKMQEKINN